MRTPYTDKHGQVVYTGDIVEGDYIQPYGRGRIVQSGNRFYVDSRGKNNPEDFLPIISDRIRIVRHGTRKC